MSTLAYYYYMNNLLCHIIRFSGKKISFNPYISTVVDILFSSSPSPLFQQYLGSAVVCYLQYNNLKINVFMLKFNITRIKKYQMTRNILTYTYKVNKT